MSAWFVRALRGRRQGKQFHLFVNRRATISPQLQQEIDRAGGAITRVEKSDAGIKYFDDTGQQIDPRDLGDPVDPPDLDQCPPPGTAPKAIPKPVPEPEPAPEEHWWDNIEPWHVVVGAAVVVGVGACAAASGGACGVVVAGAAVA